MEKYDKALLLMPKNIVQAKQYLDKRYMDAAPSERMVKKVSGVL